MRLIVRTGNPVLLRQIESVVTDKETYDSIIVSQSITQFKALVDKRDKYERSVDQAKLRRRIGPMLVVVTKRHELLNMLVDLSFRVCTEAFDLILSKLESIFRAVIKTDVQLDSILDEIFEKTIDETMVRNATSVLFTLLSSVRKRPPLIDAIVSYTKSFYAQNTQVFEGILRMAESSRVGVLVSLLFEDGSADLQWVYQLVGISPTDLALSVVQGSEELFVRGNQDGMIDSITSNDLALEDLLPVFRRVTQEMPAYEEKGWPRAFYHLIYRMAEQSHHHGQGIDVYLGVFKQLITNGAFQHTSYWSELIRFAGLSRVIGEETIPKLLPESFTKKYFEDYRHQRSLMH